MITSKNARIKLYNLGWYSDLDGDLGFEIWVFKKNPSWAVIIYSDYTVLCHGYPDARELAAFLLASVVE